MSDSPFPPAADAEITEATRFDWHPDYRGRTVGEVRATLLDDLRSDQRAYALTIDGPPENESQILVRVVGLEKKWGPYALDWATAEPGEVIDRAIPFEVARDRAHELFPYNRYRDRNAPARPATASSGGSGGDDAAPWWAFWRR